MALTTRTGLTGQDADGRASRLGLSCPHSSVSDQLHPVRSSSPSLFGFRFSLARVYPVQGKSKQITAPTRARHRPTNRSPPSTAVPSLPTEVRHSRRPTYLRHTAAERDSRYHPILNSYLDTTRIHPSIQPPSDIDQPPPYRANRIRGAYSPPISDRLEHAALDFASTCSSHHRPTQ